jgi:hypothetical protein
MPPNTEKPSSTAGRLSVDELLKTQSSAASAVTVEAVDGQPSLVKLTPWRSGAGCSCHLAIEVPKDSISHVVPTGTEHLCCGKVLKVVEVHFKETSSMSLPELLRQMSSRAGHADHPGPESHMQAGAADVAQAFGSVGGAAQFPYSPTSVCAQQCVRSLILCDYYGGSNCECNFRNCTARCSGRPQQRCLPDF